MSFNRWHPERPTSGYSFHVSYNLSTAAYELRVLKRLAFPVEKTLRAEVNWVEHDDASSIHLPPTLSMEEDFGRFPLQDLFNALWDSGIRPTVEDINLDAVVAAKDQNLDDLRTVLFSQMGIQK